MEARIPDLINLNESMWFNAAKNNNIAVLRNFFLQADKLLDKKDEYGNTALMLAIQAGNTDTVEFLLLLGADLEHIKNNQQNTAYQLFTSDIKHLTEKKFHNLSNIIQEHQGKPNGRTTMTINCIKSYIRDLKAGECFLTFKDYFELNFLPKRLFPTGFTFYHKIAGKDINPLLELSNLIESETFFNEFAGAEELFSMFAGISNPLKLEKLSEHAALKILKKQSPYSVRFYLLNQKKFQVEVYRSCPVFHVDLSKGSFECLDLRGLCIGSPIRDSADLKYNSNFNHAKLKEVNISNAVAINLPAEESEFNVANWENCILSAANFRKAKLTHIRNKNITFEGAHFELTLIDNCAFEASNGERCFANGAKIYNTSFAYSNMQLSNFSVNRTSDDHRSAILQNIDVNGADFSFSTFYRAEIGRISGIADPKTKFKNAVFIDAVWKDPETLRLMKLHHKKAFYSFNQLKERLSTGKVLKDLNLSYLDIKTEKEKKFPQQSKMKRVKFIYSELTDCSLEACELIDADFEGANLEKVNFNGASLKTTSFRKCILGKTNFNNTSLHQADFRESAFTSPITFENADISGADFRYIKFSQSSDVPTQIKNFLSAKNLTGAIFPEQCTEYLEKSIFAKGKDCREYQMLKALLKKGAGLHLSEPFVKKYDIKNSKSIIENHEKRIRDLEASRFQVLNLQHKLFWQTSLDEEALLFQRVKYSNIFEELESSPQAIARFAESTKNRNDYQVALQDEIFNYIISGDAISNVQSSIVKYRFLSPKKRQQLLTYEHDVRDNLSAESYTAYLSYLASSHTLTPVCAYLYAEEKGQSLCIWQEIDNQLVLQYKTSCLMDSNTIHLLYDKATNWVQISLAPDCQFNKMHQAYFLIFDGFMNLKKQAHSGDIQAQHTLGCIYYHGKFRDTVIYLTQNKEMAYKWYRMAASTVDPISKQSDFYRDSPYRLGQDTLVQFFSNPESVSDQELEIMKYWLQQSADANYCYAKHSLLCYYVKLSKLLKLDSVTLTALVDISNQLRLENFNDAKFKKAVKHALEEADVVIIRGFGVSIS